MSVISVIPGAVVIAVTAVLALHSEQVGEATLGRPLQQSTLERLSLASHRCFGGRRSS